MGREKVYKLVFQGIYFLIFSIVLFCVTMIVINPKKYIQLYPYPGTAVHLFADSELPEGTSKAAWIDREQGLFTCEIGYGVQYPYCGVIIKYKDSASPNYDIPDEFAMPDATSLDLSTYERVHLSVDYVGESNAMNFFLRNIIDEKPLTLDAYGALPYIHYEYDPMRKPNEVEFSRMAVARWWIDRVKPPQELRTPRFDKVFELGIDLPALSPAGIHRFKLNSITASKSYFSQMHLLITIYALAGVAILVFLVQLLTSFWARRLTEENRALRSTMIIDPLTKCLNRLGLETVIGEMFPVADGASVYVMILDLDHFKKINDTLGHATGDEVLRKVSFAISQELRADDFFGRWGGEEFIIISKISGDKLEVMIGRLMRALQSITLQGPVETWNVTMSVGVTDARKGESFDTTFKRADEALYQVKQSGRNNWKLG